MMDAYEIKDDVGYDGWVHAACIIASEPINQHNLVYLAEAALGDDPLHEAGSEAGRSRKTQAGGKALERGTHGSWSCSSRGPAGTDRPLAITPT